VLDQSGKPIPRLYAAGELGSLFAWLYEAGGGLAECIVFGRSRGTMPLTKSRSPRGREALFP